MAKIDTSKIEGYDQMSAEEKLAALEAFEYEDNSAEFERLTNAVSKANSEAAAWKRKHKELLSEEERKKQEDAEHLARMENELAELRKEKKVSEYKAGFLALGYDEALAGDTAIALAEGDITKIFANQQKFKDEYTKSLKSDALRSIKRPPSGGEESAGYERKLEEARAQGDIAAQAYYTRLIAQDSVK